MWAEFHWLRPLWLLALPFLALLLWAWWRQGPRQDPWRDLVDPHLLAHLREGTSAGRSRLPVVLLALGWLLAVLALAGPTWERLPEPTLTASSHRVLLLDLSPSMNAADLAPSRLARARFEVLDLLRGSAEGQVALLAFGPEPFVVSPLTRDARTIAEQVPRLSGDLLPVQGARRTDRALDAAAELLRQSGARAGQIILVTDGLEDPARALAAAQRLRAAGHRLDVLWVGTPGGAPVPVPGGGFLGAADGMPVIARLDAEPLRLLARTGGGRALEARADAADTRALLSAWPPPRAEVMDADLPAVDRWREQGPWLLLLALPLAALALRRGWGIWLLLGVLILPHEAAWALSWRDLWWRADQQGAQALAAEDAARAAERFQDPAWRAAARYRAGQYAAALESLHGLSGPQVDYNRGNALARLGDLAGALEAYEQALAAAPDFAEARHNRDLVRALLDREPPESATQDGDPETADDGPGEDGAGASDPSTGDSTGESSGADDAGSDQAAESAAAGASDPADTRGASPVEGEAEPSFGAAEPPLSPDDLAPEPGPDSELGSAPESEPESEQAPSEPTAGAAASAPLTDAERERQQALETQLRRVPDDPGGLLRQRFLLQHLRREGQLP